MKQVAGLQAVNAEGKVIGTLSVDDLTELVATKIVQEAKNEAVSARSASVMSEASTLAATDEYEDQLALDTNPAYIRSLDSNGNPKRTAIASLASVVGGLIKNISTEYTLQKGVKTLIATRAGLYYILEKTGDSLSCLISFSYSNANNTLGAKIVDGGSITISAKNSNLYATFTPSGDKESIAVKVYSIASR